jgi:HSP20 family protein
LDFLTAIPLNTGLAIDLGTWAPAVDIKEEKDQFIVHADIPGVDISDIHISLENNLLTIQGKREFQKTENKEEYSRIERMQGQFYRRFSLPQSADESKIDASYKNGVLQILIPKKESVKGKRIEVRNDG